jgi:hypothetical protein
MTDLGESDLIKRDDLYELLCVDLNIDAVEFQDGWSLRTAGSRELGYLRKMDGWTREQVASVTYLLQAAEDIFCQRWEEVIDDLDGIPADSPVAAGNIFPPIDLTPTISRVTKEGAKADQYPQIEPEDSKDSRTGSRQLPGICRDRA